MTTIQVGETVLVKKDTFLLREGVTIHAGTCGNVVSLVAIDAGYVRVNDYIVYFHASELNPWLASNDFSTIPSENELRDVARIQPEEVYLENPTGETGRFT